MVSKILGLLNKEIKTINQGALLLAIFSLSSQVLGLIRDRSLAHFFGPSEVLDTYYASFRIPDFLYNSFSSFVAVTALLPLLSAYLKNKESGGEGKDIRNFSHSLFTVFTVFMVLICLLIALFMNPLSFLIAPGFSIEQRELFVTLSRILLTSPIFLGLSNLFGSFAQVQKKFFAFALAPILYNFFILVGIFLFRPTMGITGVVLGVALGALVHMAIQVPTMFHLKTFPKFTLKPNFKFIKKVVKISVPRTLSLSLSNLTLVMFGAIASLMAAGSISVFNFSYNIQTTPFYIIGISYAVATFPSLSKFFQENKYEEFSLIMYKAIKNIIFFSVPISLMFIVLRAQIVRVLLGSGMFDWSDTKLVAASLALFSISIVAQSFVSLMVRSFYAIGNTKIPLRINILSLFITALFATILIIFYSERNGFSHFLNSLLRIDGISGTEIIVLPLAFSLGQVFNAITLWFMFKKKTKNIIPIHGSIGKMVFHIIGASVISAFFTYIALNVFDSATRYDTLLGVLTQGLLSGTVGLIVYLTIIRLLNNNELKDMVGVITSKFWKQKPITPEQPDL